MKKVKRLLNQSSLYLFPGLALLLALFARETSEAARNAVYLCLDVVIPSLFPFFVLSRLMVPYLSNFSCPVFLRRLFYRLFGLPYYLLPAIVLGYLSGNPTGAKMARDMMEEGVLDPQQASKLITVTTNCSPLFIIGTIGAGLFKSISIGFILLAIHWFSGLLAAVMLNLFKRKSTGESKGTLVFDGYPLKGTKGHRRLPALIPPAIEDAAILSIKVTGYIVLFAVLAELLGRLGVFSFLSGAVSLLLPGSKSISGFQELMTSIMKGVLEITSGSKAISVAMNTAVIVQLAAVSLICGFAGFSIHTQIMGLMRGTGVRYRLFLTGRILHGTIACLLTALVLSFMPLSIQTSGIEYGGVESSWILRILMIGVLIGSLLINPFDNENTTVRKRPGSSRKPGVISKRQA